MSYFYRTIEFCRPKGWQQRRVRNFIMNLERLYDHTDKMLNDDELSVQEKRSMLYDWRRKTEAKIGTSILSASEIKDASEFLAHLSLRQSALANSKRCHGKAVDIREG